MKISEALSLRKLPLHQLKEKFSKVIAKSIIALNRLADLVNLPQAEDLTPREIHKLGI